MVFGSFLAGGGSVFAWLGKTDHFAALVQDFFCPGGLTATAEPSCHFSLLSVAQCLQELPLDWDILSSDLAGRETLTLCLGASGETWAPTSFLS